MRHGTAIVISLLLVGLSPLDGEPSAGNATPVVASDRWPGWRGLAAEGRSTAPLPTRWSASDGILWKTPIPGRGFSSPIVDDASVYVTTADVTRGGAVAQTVVRTLTLGVLTLLVAILVQRVVWRCHPDRMRRPGDLIGCIFVACVGAVLAIVGVSGDSLFDFERGPIRGWMASIVFTSICVALAAATTSSTAARLAIGIGTLAFAAFALVAFPFRDVTFRAGWSSLRMQVALAASAAPLLAGCGIVLLLFAPRVRMRRTLAVAAVMIVVTFVALVAAAIQHLLTFRDVSFPETVYTPRLSNWSLLLIVVALGAAIARARLRIGSQIVNLAVVSCSVMAVVFTAGVAIESLTVRSPYLAYQLGEPMFAPLDGTSLVHAIGVTVLWMTWLPLRRRAHAAPSACRWPDALTVTALALGAIFFICVNYVPAHSDNFRGIVSLDRQSGRVNWMVRGLEGRPPAIDGRNSLATPTPATDGRLICAYFGSAGVLCATREGQVAWSRPDIGRDGHYGAAFSPVLSDGRLVIAEDGDDGVAWIRAFDARTGESAWSRTFATTPTLSGNSRTPIVRSIDGETVVILWGMFYVKAVSLRSGDTIWSHELTSGGDLVSSAVSDERTLYLSDATGTVALDLASVRSGGHAVRWKSAARSNCVSPVLANGILFTVTDSGIAAAVDTDTGELLWRQRLPGHYFASLVASPTAVYLTNSDGLTTVVAAERVFRLVSQNDLDEKIMASMAAAGGRLFIRSTAHVYAVDSR